MNEIISAIIGAIVLLLCLAGAFVSALIPPKK
jgi:hypothetical protein